MQITFILLMTIHTPTMSESVMVGQFEKGDLQGWTEKIFNKNTIYRIVDIAGKQALQSVSNNSASGLYKKVKIDLTKTPYLNWSWRIDNTLTNTDEKSKQGDDYAARVYVIFSGGLLFWRTHSLNYVWSSNQKEGSHWPNAYTDNNHMIAVNSGKPDSSQWVSVKRNIRNDYKAYFGADINSAEAIAIMTDTDNSGQQAISYYGNIFFSSE